jgi:hypothetical protein
MSPRSTTTTPLPLIVTPSFPPNRDSRIDAVGATIETDWPIVTAP